MTEDEQIEDALAEIGCKCGLCIRIVGEFIGRGESWPYESPPCKCAAVDDEGAYVSRRCPDQACIARGEWAVVCERCESNGCDECIIDDGDGYICDSCRTATGHA